MSERNSITVAAQPPQLWRNRDYAGWWAGNTLSALGTSVSTISYPLLVLATTGSASQAGLIGSANLFGITVTALYGGVLADRVSRRAILLIGPLVQAVVLVAVTVLVYGGHTAMAVLVASALISGLASGIVMAAGTPALRRIVPAEQLPAANGQAVSRDMIAQLLGAPLGGILFGLARWVPFLADAVSFLFAALGAANIRRPLGPERDAAVAPNSVVKDIGDGLRFVRHQPFLRFVVLMASVLNMVAQAFTLLLIALVAHRGGSPATVGVVTGLLVAGALAGSVVGPTIARRLAGRTLLAGAIWLFAVCVAATALVPAIWAIGTIVFLAQLATVPINVVVMTYVMRLVPDSLLGRVAAVNRFGAYGLEWLGPLLAGLLVALFGASGGMLALLVLIVPLAVLLMISPALNILATPIERVAEIEEPAG